MAVGSKQIMLERVYPMCFLVVTLTLLSFIAVGLNPGYGGTSVLLPLTHKPDIFFNTDNFTVLTIKRDGSLFFNAEYIVETKLNQVSAQQRESVLVSADTRLPFGIVRKALALLRSNGERNIILLSEGELTVIERINGRWRRTSR